jgi:hypothetical protein
MDLIIPGKDQVVVPDTIKGTDTDTNVQGLHIETTDGSRGALSTPNSPDSFVDKDVEKQAAHEISRTSSIPSLEPNNKNPNSDGEEAPDPNIVWWDGDDDPENPMNWSSATKWGAISVVAAITFLTPLGSAIFAPGVEAVLAEFHSNSQLLSGFIVSIYVLGFAVGPLGK